MGYDVIIVGAGLSGAVLAERFANINKRVLIIEKRNHIGGNCYDYVDKETGILMNMYGAHLFHTNDDGVWSYINKFDEWTRWDHRVIGNVNRRLVPIPVNMNTVNALLNETIKTEDEMDEWLSKNQVKYDQITNSEQMGKSRVGTDLYNLIFRDYTKKQWDKYPEELKPEVLSRIPVRNNLDDRYFSDRYQALPKYGYTHFIRKLLENNNIDVLLNVDYMDVKDIHKADITIFTGPIDQYFQDSGLDKLEYRSIDFRLERHMNTPYYQTNSVVNYPGLEVDFTRIVEYKHFLHQESPHTIIAKEYTTDNGEPYYPVPNEKNMSLYEEYKTLAENETATHFVGRLANYKYFNMDQAIRNALDYFDENFSSIQH